VNLGEAGNIILFDCSVIIILKLFDSSYHTSSSGEERACAEGAQCLKKNDYKNEHIINKDKTYLDTSIICSLRAACCRA